MKAFGATLLLLLFAPGLPSADESSLGTLKHFDLPDAHGRTHTAAAWKERKAVVLLFLGRECPVSNGYAPEYRRLEETYARQRVGFYGIHPDPEITAEQAAQHAAEFRLPFPVLLDPKQVVARQAGIKVVPEAVVLSPLGQLLYRGRIDDLYLPGGKRREEARTHDLEEALKAVLVGQRPRVSVTQAFGCPLPQPVKSSNKQP